jgi:MFS family permease
MFNAGVFTTGTSAILFGLLDRVPGHTLFITLAFLIRIVEALGNAAFLTASFTIIAAEFPDSVATSFATLETFFGFGLIVGPLVSLDELFFFKYVSILNKLIKCELNSHLGQIKESTNVNLGMSYQYCNLIQF